MKSLLSRISDDNARVFGRKHAKQSFPIKLTLCGKTSRAVLFIEMKISYDELYMDMNIRTVVSIASLQWSSIGKIIVHPGDVVHPGDTVHPGDIKGQLNSIGAMVVCCYAFNFILTAEAKTTMMMFLRISIPIMSNWECHFLKCFSHFYSHWFEVTNFTQSLILGNEVRQSSWPWQFSQSNVVWLHSNAVAIC